MPSSEQFTVKRKRCENDAVIGYWKRQSKRSGLSLVKIQNNDVVPSSVHEGTPRKSSSEQRGWKVYPLLGFLAFFCALNIKYSAVTPPERRKSWHSSDPAANQQKDISGETVQKLVSIGGPARRFGAVSRRKECGMLKRDQEALRSCSVRLVKDLVVDELLIQTLVKDAILTPNMAENIMVQKTSHQRSFKLILLLPKRGPKAFKSFCSALKATEQDHLCDLLTPEKEGREVCLDSVQPEMETTGRPSRLDRADNKREAPLLNREEQSEVSSSTPYPVHDSDSCCCSGPSARDEKERQRVKARGSDKHRDRFESSLPLPTQEEFAPKRAKTHATESMEFSLDSDSPINNPVLACSADFYRSHCQQSYRMSSSPRGLALVFSNNTFDPCASSELDPRKGGEVDEEVLRKLFTELDYSVNVHRDLTAQEMKMCIENFCRRPDHQNVDSCVVCLLSHGVDGAVYGTDGQLLALDWVFEAFDNAHCPLLQNKPKMFFIQACRGDEMDCGVEQIDGPARTFSPTCEQRDAGREEQGDADGRQRASTGRQRIKLPQRSDMICGFASLKGTAAMRNTKKGSWFIQELNTALRRNARDTHLADILVQVNRRIKEREGYAPGTAHHRCKEMSEFTSSLCKDLYLFPKYQPQC